MCIRDSPVYEVPNGDIDFEHVNFAYKHGSGKYALQDINLHIKSGETIGVIGGTGTGKSSLVNLICRLYDVTDGSVKVGDIDVRNYDMDSLRNQVAVVLQKNTLFSGTILENLRWGNPEATEEQCVACLLYTSASPPPKSVENISPGVRRMEPVPADITATASSSAKVTSRANSFFLCRPS